MKSISDPDLFLFMCSCAHIAAPLSLRKSCPRDSQALCHMLLTDWYRTQLLTFFNSTKNSSHMFSNFKTDVLQVFLQPFCKTIFARLFPQDYFCKTIFARLFLQDYSQRRLSVPYVALWSIWNAQEIIVSGLAGAVPLTWWSIMWCGDYSDDGNTHNIDNIQWPIALSLNMNSEFVKILKLYQVCV